MNDPKETGIIIVALISPDDVSHPEIESKISKLSHSSIEDCPYYFDVRTFKGATLGRGRSQDEIDKFIRDANVSIAVFRNRVGTKFENESSATVHEINNVLLRRMRKKNAKNSPQIKIFFLSPDILEGKVKKLNTEILDGLLEIQKLKKAMGKEDKLYYECKNEEEMNDKIKNDLKNYAKSLSDIVQEESDFFMENMISERIFAYLEMDNGYSERIFKLFDCFYYKNEEKICIDKYYTNFIFDYASLDDDRLDLLLQRFKGLFANFVCERIQKYRENRAEKGAFPERLTHYNFRDFACILNDDTYENDTHSFESILDMSGRKMVADIAKTLHSNIFWNIGRIDEKYKKTGEHHEYIEKAKSEITPKCSPKCSHLLSANRDGSKKVFVFLAPMITQSLLNNVNQALSYLCAEIDDFPDVFLFSVIESPSKKELEFHLKNYIDDIKLKYLKGLCENNKLHYHCYLDRARLDSDDIMDKIYYKI